MHILLFKEIVHNMHKLGRVEQYGNNVTDENCLMIGNVSSFYKRVRPWRNETTLLFSCISTKSYLLHPLMLPFQRIKISKCANLM